DGDVVLQEPGPERAAAPGDLVVPGPGDAVSVLEAGVAGPGRSAPADDVVEVTGLGGPRVDPRGGGAAHADVGQAVYGAPLVEEGQDPRPERGGQARPTEGALHPLSALEHGHTGGRAGQ